MFEQDCKVNRLMTNLLLFVKEIKLISKKSLEVRRSQLSYFPAYFKLTAILYVW